MKRKIAIIGASAFQEPLIRKAQEMGLETHVFAWECGDVGETLADEFHPISITEIEEITAVCRELGISGICSIGTDLGNITVSRVANSLGLVANSVECVERSTNKHLMRERFFSCGDPSPLSIEVRSTGELAGLSLSYPVIVKPVDRSGSRCVTRLESADGLESAVQSAIDVSFSKAAVVEEYVSGTEYSVEYVSWKGAHTFLALTRKYTTGAPHFIETGHIEPADVSEDLLAEIRSVVEHALDSLGVEYGASHSEVMVTPQHEVKIIEIGSRMGGDCIGSDLVPISTGVDYVRAVISIALGEEPNLAPLGNPSVALIRFLVSEGDRLAFENAKTSIPEHLVRAVIPAEVDGSAVVDSSSRHGFFILRASRRLELLNYLPAEADGR